MTAAAVLWIALALNLVGFGVNLVLLVCQVRTFRQQQRRQVEMVRAVSFTAAVAVSPRLFSAQVIGLARASLPSWVRDELGSLPMAPPPPPDARDDPGENYSGRVH